MSDLISGDCLLELATLEAGSVDLIATDPPYGLSFMGKDWDRAVPSVAIWRECFRVLKPGAFAFVMSSPRLDVLAQMAVRLAEAGFNTGFTPIYWAYASGFPKATNISKAVDKRLGVEREVIGKKETNWVVHNDGPATIAIGEEGTHRAFDITEPTSPEAKSLDGSYAGFQPKPAVEVIIVCMKPLSEKTYVEQALRNGKGVTWLDAGRIPINPEVDDPRLGGKGAWTTTQEQTIFGGGAGIPRGTVESDERGRFPANLLVSDDVLNDGTNYRTGGPNGTLAGGMGEQFGRLYGNREMASFWRYNDSGSFSRYFSLDAWWEKKVSELPKEVQKTFPFLIEPKASKGERNEGLDGFELHTKASMSPDSRSGNPQRPSKGMERFVTTSHNKHPTVKPIAIMSYLISLGSRQGDVVLDPFLGSGTTGIAAKILHREFVGIEIDPESFKIAEARIKAEHQVILTEAAAKSPPESSR